MKIPDNLFDPTRWWRITLDNGQLWAESSDRDEIRGISERLKVDGTTHKVECLYSVTVSAWREETP